jgi:hypothetical protein
MARLAAYFSGRDLGSGGIPCFVLDVFERPAKTSSGQFNGLAPFDREAP